ncbi:MAG: hypothetical protein JWR83_2421 [Aeromicrobium sp.]|nr:hypothetical protein [Aeromicrobium sp.]
MASHFLDRVYAATDAEGRLPLPDQAMWEIFPFEPDHLVVKPLDDPEFPEPSRHGEGGVECDACAQPDQAVWSNANWTLSGLGSTGLPFAAMLQPRAHLDLDDLSDEQAAELGVLTVRIVRAAGDLPDVARVHVNKWGDGAEHLHVFFFGRPAGLQQLRGSNLALWEEMLPRVPETESAGALQRVAAQLS